MTLPGSNMSFSETVCLCVFVCLSVLEPHVDICRAFSSTPYINPHTHLITSISPGCVSVCGGANAEWWILCCLCPQDMEGASGVKVQGHTASDSVSLPSYAEYPSSRPLFSTRLPTSPRPITAFPESSSAGEPFTAFTCQCGVISQSESSHVLASLSPPSEK